MTVRIVTDSTSDLSPELISKHGIEVVPLNVHFADNVYKDGKDITADQFFDKLINGPIHPTTSQPSIGEFVDVYRKIADKGDQIVSIHISQILSGTYNSAFQASKTVEGEIDVHLIDSEQVSMSLGLSAIAAAQTAKQGGTVDEVIAAAESAAKRCRFVALFDTLEYLAKGGRIGKAQSLLGGLLKIRPILTVENGEIAPFSKARSRKSGLSKLQQAIRSFGDIEELYVMYSTETDDAETVAKSLGDLLPSGKSPMVMRVGPVIGTHAGPDLLGVGCLTAV